jgi:hypothetical protein
MFNTYLNAASIPNTTSVRIIEATQTTTVLRSNASNLGHVTLYINSL